MTGAARRLIEDGRPTVAALGPIAGMDAYDAITERLG